MNTIANENNTIRQANVNTYNSFDKMDTSSDDKVIKITATHKSRLVHKLKCLFADF